MSDETKQSITVATAIVLCFLIFFSWCTFDNKFERDNNLLMAKEGYSQVLVKTPGVFPEKIWRKNPPELTVDMVERK